MWRTLDGHALRLPRSGRVAIAAPSHLTGGRASLLRPGGEPDPAAIRFVGRLARNAVREGTRRGPLTGRPYSAFEAEVAGRRYTLLARPSPGGGAATLAAIEPERGRFSGEFSDGIGHRRAQNRIYDWLSRQGLQDVSVLERTDPAAVARGEGIRDNRGQLIGLGGGPPMPNDPDVSYPGYIAPGDLRRVNVEIDTTVPGRQGHIDTLTRNDPNSMHIFMLVDPITGRPLERHVWDPRLQRLIRVARNQRLPRPGFIQAPQRGTRGTQLPLFPPRMGGTRGTQLSLGLPAPIQVPPAPTPPRPATTRQRRARRAATVRSGGIGSL